MPQSGRRKVLKIPFKRSDGEGESPEKCSSTPLRAKGINNIKSVIPSFENSETSNQSYGLLRKVFSNGLQRVKIVGGVPQKSTLNSFFCKLLKSRNVTMKKTLMRNTTLLNKKVSNSNITRDAFIQKEHTATRFLSILVGKGRVIRHKLTAQLLGRKVGRNTEEPKRLLYAQKLQLFQALLKEPLPFLELHIRFGASKKTIRRLVENGLLAEVWGPKAIGVRFKLSKKGIIHLKELEAAARYESKLREKNLIRLKHSTTF